MNQYESKQYDVFLSHYSADKPWVIKLKDDLQRYGVSVWLDKDEIRPGDLFSIALEQALEQCRSVALIVSPEATASGWVKEEYYRALSLSRSEQKQFQLIPVILKDIELPGFLQSRNWIDFRDESIYAENVWRLVWGIKGRKPDKILDFNAPDLVISPPSIEVEDTFRRVRKIGEVVLEFLDKAGFDHLRTLNENSFIVMPRERRWNKHFREGLYVCTFSDAALTNEMVHSIYQAAKGYSHYALVAIDQLPKDNVWMTISGLRADERDPFVLLLISETTINKAIAEQRESREFNLFVRKELGQDYDPYDVRDPVSDDVNFCGRGGLLNEMLDEIRLGQRLGLFGLHKMGKSSVMQRLQSKLGEIPVAYVYLKREDSLTSIFNRILKAWEIDLRIKYRNFSWIPREIIGGRESHSKFDVEAKALLSKLEQEIDNPLLGIFLDEIDIIVPHRKGKGDEAKLDLYLILMDSLRGLQQETGCLSLLVAGIHPTLSRVNYFWDGEQKNPMHQVITERFLSPLEKEDCKAMIRGLGGKIRLTYDEEAADYVFRMSGGHPFLARQLCSRAFKQKGDIGEMRFEEIRTAAHLFVRNPSTASYFDDYALWRELGQQEIWGVEASQSNYSILRALAASHEGMTKSELCTDPGMAVKEQSLNALQERSVISYIPGTKRYGITIGLFQEWICLHKLTGE